ncbi:leucine-rich repeat domain-containing protein [Ralstonia sp. 1B3]|uniref:leucine-rich repeat domain-containing protein n=1 Tax=Ralstonia sp. 1B3 TaxID=2997421 RepID=UPI002FCB46D8
MLHLPDLVSEIAHLKALHVSDCDLRELPHDLSNLGMLETLKLQNNPRLHTVPDTLGQLASLKHLEIVGSGVRALPAMHGLANLEHLAIQHSPLTSLPRDIGNARKLKTLSLAHTYLREVPASIGNLSKLTELDLRHNVGLTSVPDSIGQLRQLKTLDLSYCPQLRAVPASVETCATSRPSICVAARVLPCKVCRNRSSPRCPAARCTSRNICTPKSARYVKNGR